MELKPDVVVGKKYRILRKLHESSRGVVYLASHVLTERRVNLEVARRDGDEHGRTDMRASSAGLPREQRGALVRSRAEETLASSARAGVRSRAAEHVAHRGLVEPLETGTDGANVWVALELMRGESLARRLERGPLELEELRFVFAQLLDIVAAVHRAGIVHGHLSPERVFLEENVAGALRVRLLDFEVVSHQDRLFGTHSSASTAVVVPRAYQAPEQRADDAVLAITPSSDVFALGAILFACLSAQRPLDLARLAARTANSTGELPLELEEAVLEPYASIAGYCLAFTPVQRPSSCEDLRRLFDMGGSRPPPLPRPLPALPAPKRNVRGWLGLGALACAGILIALVYARAESRSPATRTETPQPQTSQRVLPARSREATSPPRSSDVVALGARAEPVRSLMRSLVSPPIAEVARSRVAPRPGRVERSYRLDVEGASITRPDASSSPKSGTRDADARQALRHSAGQLERCYDAALRASLDAQLRAVGLAARITVEPSGETSAVVIDGDAPDELIQCIRAVVSTWRFAKTESRAQLQVPLDFSGAKRLR